MYHPLTSGPSNQKVTYRTFTITNVNLGPRIDEKGVFVCNRRSVRTLQLYPNVVEGRDMTGPFSESP